MDDGKVSIVFQIILWLDEPLWICFVSTVVVAVDDDDDDDGDDGEEEEDNRNETGLSSVICHDRFAL